MRMLLIAIILLNCGCGATAELKNQQDIPENERCVWASDTITYWAEESHEFEDQCVVRVEGFEYYAGIASSVIYNFIKEKLEMSTQPEDIIEIRMVKNTLQSVKTGPFCSGYIQFSWQYYIDGCNSPLHHS